MHFLRVNPILEAKDNGGTPQKLTSSTNSVFFCPDANGDSVSFTVQSVCPNDGPGGVSSPYSFKYSAPTLSAPTGLQFDTFPPFTVSWNAVIGNISRESVTLQEFMNSKPFQRTPSMHLVKRLMEMNIRLPLPIFSMKTERSPGKNLLIPRPI